MARKKHLSLAKGIPKHIVDRTADLGSTPYIYVLRSGDVYKIGKTTNDVYLRILDKWRDFGRPDDFEIINCIPVDNRKSVHRAERVIHGMFDDKRPHKRIEHFHLNSDEVCYIKSLTGFQNDQFITTG